MCCSLHVHEKPLCCPLLGHVQTTAGIAVVLSNPMEPNRELVTLRVTILYEYNTPLDKTSMVNIQVTHYLTILAVFAICRIFLQ